MNSLQKLLRAQEFIPTDTALWERMKARSTQFKDNIIAAKSYPGVNRDWEVLQIVSNSAKGEGPSEDEFLLMLLMDCRAGAEIHCQFGERMLVRPGEAGNMIFFHDSQLPRFWGEGPFYNVIFRVKRTAFGSLGIPLELARVEAFEGLYYRNVYDVGVELLLKRLLGECRSLRRKEELCGSLIRKIVVRLSRLSEMAGEKREARVKEVGEVMRGVVAYVEGHLGERLSREELALMAGMSEGHFSRQFRASTGVSLREYLLAARVEGVRGLLRTTTLSLDEVAVRCGFTDQSHMGREFKRVVGVSPRLYRVG